MLVGIDLGTTNSLVAIWRDGKSELIPNALGEVLTPSCVSIDDDGSILIGKAARERLQTHPDRSAAVFKRFMGCDRQLMLAGRSFRAEELSALILRSLKADAEEFLGHPVEEAVITVPAYFSDAQRKATRAAGQIAGLRVEGLLNEPTAAALAYGIHQRSEESCFLVFDLGGGTFDVSVLELFDDVMEVRATAGDNHLGGEDFSAALVAEFLDKAAVPERLSNDAGFLLRLGAEAERAKHLLSLQAKATMRVTGEGHLHALEINEELLERIWSPLLSRLRMPIERALRDAKLRSGDLDKVVLAGGATRMPLVRKLVTRMFGRFPACELNPDEVVALGAAVQAGLRMKDSALKEVVMTDVAPYSLGVETILRTSNEHWMHGCFSPIIDRNTPIPVSRSSQYSPVRDGQRQIEFKIYQGEARLVQDNILLGSLTLDLPPGSGPERVVDVRFTYDVNGLLEVEAQVPGFGSKKRILIEDNPGLLSESEIRERFQALADLKIHPRERQEYRTTLARAERLFQQMRGEERSHFGLQIALFEEQLDAQELRAIATAHERFSCLVDSLERETSLGTLLD